MSPPPDQTTARTVNLDHCLQTSVQRDSKCLSDYQMSQCGTQSACRGQTKSFLGNLGSLGGWTLGSMNVEGGLHPPFPVLTKLDKVTENHQLLCTSSQEPLPVRGIISAYGQRCSRSSSNPKISGLLQLTFLSSKARQLLETILNLFLKAEKFKMETLETIRTSLQLREWVT